MGKHPPCVEMAPSEKRARLRADALDRVTKPLEHSSSTHDTVCVGAHTAQAMSACCSASTCCSACRGGGGAVAAAALFGPPEQQRHPQPNYDSRRRFPLSAATSAPPTPAAASIEPKSTAPISKLEAAAARFARGSSAVAADQPYVFARFKQQHDFPTRQAEAARQQQLHPGRLALVVGPAAGSVAGRFAGSVAGGCWDRVLAIDEMKFIVPPDQTVRNCRCLALAHCVRG